MGGEAFPVSGTPISSLIDLTAFFLLEALCCQWDSSLHRRTTSGGVRPGSAHARSFLEHPRSAGNDCLCGCARTCACRLFGEERSDDDVPGETGSGSELRPVAAAVRREPRAA